MYYFLCECFLCDPVKKFQVFNPSYQTCREISGGAEKKILAEIIPEIFLGLKIIFGLKKSLKFFGPEIIKNILAI